MSIFEEIKGNLGFGCMRLPMKDDEVDYTEFSKMIDSFLENGFNYFDTAHMYVNGKSETALRDCLAKRHKREEYILTNKLSTPYFNSEEEIIPLFESQLELCGVDYFDFYLMHAQNKSIFEKFKRCRAYETAIELKKQGRIKHFGLSFHDKAEVLEQILTEYPEVEVVQIQFNYVDYEDVSVEGRKCYEVCRKFNKPIIVMEPVKGGALVRLPENALKIFDDLKGGSPASYAIRYAASFEGIFMVLSGMGNMDMITENMGFMKNFKPIDDAEMKAINKVTDIFVKQSLVNCTACKYCISECPQNISIPDLFACLNGKLSRGSQNADYYYEDYTVSNGKASDCIECGACEEACPQKLEIRKLLKKTARIFE